MLISSKCHVRIFLYLHFCNVAGKSRFLRLRCGFSQKVKLKVVKLRAGGLLCNDWYPSSCFNHPWLENPFKSLLLHQFWIHIRNYDLTVKGLQPPSPTREYAYANETIRLLVLFRLQMLQNAQDKSFNKIRVFVWNDFFVFGQFIRIISFMY